MAYKSFKDKNFQAKFESADYILKKSTAQFIISSQISKAELYQALKYSNERMPLIQKYQAFVSDFYNVFTWLRDTIKYNSESIRDWDKKGGKEERYAAYFEANSDVTIDNIMLGIKLHNEFMGDLVKSRIMEIIKEVGVVEQGMEESVEEEVEGDVTV